MGLDSIEPFPGHLDPSRLVPGRTLEPPMPCGYCAVTPVSPCPVCEVAPANAAPIRKARGKGPARPVVARKDTTPTLRVVPAPVVAPAAIQTPRMLVLWCVDCGCTFESPYRREVCEPCLQATPVAPDPLPPGGCSGCEDCAPGQPTAEDRAAAACAKAWSEGQASVAIALVVGLADMAKRELRLQVLLAIDTLAARRGYITERDARVRGDIMAGAVAEAIERIGFDPRYPRIDPLVVRPWEHPAIAAPVAPPVVAPIRALPAPRGALLAGDWEGLADRVKRGELTEDQAKAFGTEWLRIMGRA